jgi:hypothetical protein
MHLIVDGYHMQLGYAFFADVSGHVLCLRIEKKGGATLHRQVTEGFKRIFGSVMDSENVDESGRTEIRILECTILEVIDALRVLGLPFKEVVPPPARR